MDTAALRDLLSRYYEVLNNHDLEGITDVLAAEAEFDDDFVPGVVFHSAAEVQGVFGAMWRAFPDLNFAVLHGPLFDDTTSQAMVYGCITGTLAQALPDFGLVKVGNSIDQQFMALYTARADRLSYVRVCLNRSVTAAQLG